ncbi:MAG TPA: type II toxin-antitoxin system PemK/MazF family toxin [Sporichthyaceae bacterium]|jgi:mRNA interferase MazF|nr:type II toxin-antitoxin system PemK/MazF family toxin [Sporichthyaceae bacterium]
MTPERGDIWWADLGGPRGSAPAKRRPVVIVSADAYNRSALATVVAVVVTTNLRLVGIPGNVLLPAAETGLPQDSAANVSQIATLDRAHLDGRTGTLPARLLDDLDRGLARVLGLRLA